MYESTYSNFILFVGKKWTDFVEEDITLQLELYFNITLKIG